jgi:two-component system response regulator FixJ
VVADVRMPGMSGLELQQAMKAKGLSLPVIVVTGHGDVSMAVQALKAGAVAFLEKPFDDDVFLASIGEAMETFGRIDREKRALADIRDRVAALTQRERETMRLIAEGLSNREAARELAISVRTVENHRARVMEKMQAKNLSDLVRMVLRLEDSEAA